MFLFHPVWLLLLIPSLICLWVWALPSRPLTVLRSSVLVLIVLGMCGLALKLKRRAGTLVVVVDRSRSMPHNSDAKHKEMIDLLQGKMGVSERLAVVAFGRNPTLERSPQRGKFGGFMNKVDRDGSNLEGALQLALSLIPAGHPGRILVMSDGRWTGKNPVGVVARAAAREIAIDTFLVRRAAANDVSIARLDIPNSVAPGEAFITDDGCARPCPKRSLTL